MQRSRLPKSVKSHMMKRRLDFATERRELIKNILALGGDGELEVLEDEITGFGESLEEALNRASLPRLRRIHARLVDGTLHIPEE